jgi:glycosyltransferase involved in cell wall biosynthesis
VKILIVNYRYFVSGGPERYLFNLKELLESHGHEVIPFSVRYERNESTPFAEYFVQPLSSEKEIYFGQQTWTYRSFMKSLERAVYSPEVYRNLRSLIRAERPDVALVLHYLRKLSPAVLTALSEEKVPFAVRLSDFGMICPNCHLLRNGEICRLCVTGGLRHSVRYRCVQNSFGASAVNYAATRFHQLKGYFDLIPVFITPSRMLRDEMINGGWNPDRIEYIPTFVYPDEEETTPKKRQILFAGRIDPQKGIETLIQAAGQLQSAPDPLHFKTIIAGDGPETYVQTLRSLCECEQVRDVEFAGLVTKARLFTLYKESLALVVPSISYDNMPNVILESMVRGTPVIASNHGSFPELIQDGENGLLFPARNASALARSIRCVLDDEERAKWMGEAAKRFVEMNHSPGDHYERLMNIYSKVST